MPKSNPGENGRARKTNGWGILQPIFPPEFQEALASNRPPKPGVLQSATAFRENPTFFANEAKKRIAAIDVQVKALQEERDQLADEGGVLQAVKDACSAICAPIRRIPRDVMYEIAQYAMADYPSLSTGGAPINLSQVSSAWRDVVLHSPRLWTTLYLRIQRLHQTCLLYYAQAVNTWFSRAGGDHPLNLYLYLDCLEIRSGRYRDMHHLHLFLKALSPWMPRIACLGIGGQDCLEFIKAFADLEWDLPNLHTLEILGQQAVDFELLEPDMDALRTISERITIFNDCPKLTTFIAHQEITSSFPSFRFLPWNQFTRVILEENLACEPQLATLFVFFRRLEIASITWFGAERSQAAISVDHLRQLRLDVRPRSSNDLLNFFVMFTFRSLTHLEIFIDEIPSKLRDDIQSLTGASPFPSLTVLRLNGTFPMGLIKAFLRMTPQLRTFITLYYSHMGCLDDFFKTITIRDDDPVNNTVPLLEECFIQTATGGQPVLLDASTIAGFIRSRTHNLRPSFSRFKKLSLTGGFAFFTSLHDEVARFHDATQPPVDIHLQSSGINLLDHYAMHRVEVPESFFVCPRNLNSYYDDEVGHEGLLSG